MSPLGEFICTFKWPSKTVVFLMSNLWQLVHHFTSPKWRLIQESREQKLKEAQSLLMSEMSMWICLSLGPLLIIRNDNRHQHTLAYIFSYQLSDCFLKMLPHPLLTLVITSMGFDLFPLWGKGGGNIPSSHICLCKLNSVSAPIINFRANKTILKDILSSHNRFKKWLPVEFSICVWWR